MPPTVLISPSATGKTHRCIERVQAALADRPLAPVWVVLPDRLQVASFRRRLAVHGGAIGARIGTFGDLYYEVLDAAGTPVPVACETAAAQFVNAVIAEATAQGSLAHYGGIAAYPGFARELRRVFAELKRARVQPERFMEVAKEMGPALLELADLYQAYQVMLQQAGWADPEGLSWLATKALEDAPALLASVSLVIVDGFDSFNGSQRVALRLLADRAGELVVTLPGGLAMDRPAFRRFARSLEGLRQNLPEASITTAVESPYLPPPLSALEQGLFNPATAPTASAEHVWMIEARSPAEEAREALRWIKARILRDGVRLDQCALVTPSPEQYRPLLRRAGVECGILLRFTMGEPLTSAPGIAALLGMLELPSQNWPRRLTLDVVRSPYFDLSRYGLTEGDALLLDRASLKGLVIEGLDQWDEALLALAALDGPPEDEDSEGVSSANLPYGATAARLLKVVRCLADRLSPSAERPTDGWVEWLEDLLDETGFFTRRETPVDQAALRELRLACVRAGAGKGRSVNLHPQERLLQQARALQSSPAFEAYRAQRQVAEHRLARMMQLGMRRARYFGRTKTLFQALLAPTVANLTLIAGKTGRMGRQRSQEDLLGFLLSRFKVAVKWLWAHGSSIIPSWSSSSFPWQPPRPCFRPRL